MPENITYFPLTPSQQLMYVNQHYNLHKSVVNICPMLHFDCETDQSLLLQAITLGMLRNESSRVRLHKVGKEIKQYLSDQSPDSILVEDYSDKTDAELDAAIAKWSCTAFPHGSMDTQLYTVHLVRKPNGFWGAYFCVSHLAFDAYALMATASDITAIYAALRDGTPIPPSKSNYMAMCEQEWAYCASEKRKADLKLWRDEIFGGKEEPLYSSVTGRAPTKGFRVGRALDILHSAAHHENLVLKAELAHAVNAYAQAHRLFPQTIYLMAIRSYLSRMNHDQEDITMANTTARRATLVQKRGGGTMVTGIPLRTVIPNTTPIEEALHAMYAQQVRCYSHSNFLYTEVADAVYERYGILKTRPPFDTYHSINVTYNPYSVQLPEGIKAHMTVHSNGFSSQPIYLSIMALDDSGDLTFNYDCTNTMVKEDTVRNMHAQIEKALRAIVTGKAKTVGDLNRL